jgi:diketogulonate reductase-like aldo/keto reductase
MKTVTLVPGRLARACNASTAEVETRETQIQIHPGLHRKTLVCLKQQQKISLQVNEN